MLSVIRDAAGMATDAAASERDGDDVTPIIEAALGEARRSLARTTERLPELTQARVVDAGGKGIVLMLAALLAAVQRRTPAEQVCALLVVAEGDGIIRTFRSLGAVVLKGGPGYHPSVVDLVAAIEGAPSGAIVVLLNHRDIVPAADGAAAATSKEVWVIPSS